jgi:hypothetical protein
VPNLNLTCLYNKIMSIDREKLIDKIYRTMQSLQYPQALGSGLSSGLKLARKLAPRARKAKGGAKEDDVLEDYRRWLARGSAKSAPAPESESDEDDEDEDDVAEATGGSRASAIFAKLAGLGKLDPEEMKNPKHFSAPTMLLAVNQRIKAVKRAAQITKMPTKEARAKARKADKERMQKEIVKARVAKASFDVAKARKAAKKAAKAAEEDESDAEGGAVTLLHKATKAQAEKEGIAYRDALKMLLDLEHNDERAEYGLKAKRAKAKPGDRRLKRGKIVADIMRERGVKLPEASRIAKEEKLY